MNTSQKLLILTFAITFDSFPLERQTLEITQANYKQYLTLDGVDERNFQLSSESLRRASDIVLLAQETSNVNNIIPQDPLGKSSGCVATFSGVCASGAFYTLRQTTRMPVDPTLLIGVFAGGAAFAGGVYWWMGREMGIIRSFRSDLQRALQELEKMQRLVNKLKTSNQHFANQIEETLQITQELKDALPQVLKVSGDNANLATVLGAALKEIRGQQALLTQLLARLPEHERIAMITQAQEAIPKEIEQQAQAIAQYNNHSWRRRLGIGAITQFQQIPQEWLKSHNFKDLATSEEA
jgi:hypothetical protein